MELKKDLDIFNQTYEYRGFNISQYQGDNEFNKIRPHLLTSTIHVCDSYKYIGRIERASCAVKYR